MSAADSLATSETISDPIDDEALESGDDEVAIDAVEALDDELDDLLLTIGVSSGGVALHKPASAKAKSACTMSADGKQMATLGRATVKRSNRIRGSARGETDLV